MRNGPGIEAWRRTAPAKAPQGARQIAAVEARAGGADLPSARLERDLAVRTKRRDLAHDVGAAASEDVNGRLNMVQSARQGSEAAGRGIGDGQERAGVGHLCEM